jgi:hypothetical protein
VIYGREGDLHPDLMIEILEHGTVEILGIVNGNLLRNPVMTDDILLENFLDGGGGYIAYWLRLHPFGEVLDCDNGEDVVSLCWCMFAHDINAPLL